MKPINLLLAAILLPGALLAGTAFAQDDGHRPPGPPRTPPPEAFDACKGKKVADPCAVTFQDRTMTGVCAASPLDAQQVFCRPEHPPGRPPGPPPGFFEACDGKNAGDACSVDVDGQSRQGKCSKGQSARLLCLP